jgi:hypothetical protein
MDFTFTAKELRLRDELRAFLGQTLPPDWPGPPSELADDDDQWAFAQEFNRELAARGWIAPAWPKEYGGLGASYIEQAIFAEELGYARAPHGQRIFGVNMLGPTLIVHGTEEQRREHLPGITSAKVLWCQGYSEPGSGSDLASLQTRAVRDGDDYIINGQKIWTTGAHRADWMFLLARTDPDAPKHKGISFFLLDMKTPGISVRPLINIQNRHEFNQVFFEDVRVPRRNLAGGQGAQLRGVADEGLWHGDAPAPLQLWRQPTRALGSAWRRLTLRAAQRSDRAGPPRNGGADDLQWQQRDPAQHHRAARPRPAARLRVASRSSDQYRRPCHRKGIVQIRSALLGWSRLPTPPGFGVTRESSDGLPA